MSRGYFTPQNQQGRIQLAQQVENHTLAGLNDQDISQRLNIDPSTVQHWRDWASRNLARRAPQMTAEAVEEELTRVNLWLSRLNSHYDAQMDAFVAQNENPENSTPISPPDVHKYVASFEKLSKRRADLLIMKVNARSTDPTTENAQTDEQVEAEYATLIAKLGLNG